MIATVLVGPGKPKLVHIQKPPSSQASQEGEITQSIYEGRNSHDLVHDRGPPLDARPCTPIQRPLEISMFSPYDTPWAEEPSAQHISLDSCISTIAYARSHVEDHRRKVSPSSENLVPAPLSFSSRTRASLADCSIFSSTLERLQDFADPFGTSAVSICPSDVPTCSRRKRLRRSNGRTAQSQRFNNRIRHSQSWPIDDFPQPTKQNQQENHHHHSQQISSLETSPPHRPAALTRLRKLHRLNRVLSSVTQAIDHFPSTLLNLSSPTVLELRPLNVAEQTYIDALKKIFPSASCPLLESLAAWILIDLFFEAVGGDGVPREARRDAKPRLASAFSFGSDSGSLFVGRQNNNPRLQRHYRRRESSEAFIDLSTTTSGRGSGSTIIPSKAQQMLGMNTPDVVSLRLSEHALHKRAESVSVSVAVVGQRLVEAVRGSAGWDEDIWRALRVLVIVIGGGGGSGSGSGSVGGSATVAGLCGVGNGAEMDEDKVPWDVVCERERWRRHRVVLDPSLDDDGDVDDDEELEDDDHDRSRSIDTEDTRTDMRAYRPAVYDQGHVRHVIDGRTMGIGGRGRQRDGGTSSSTSNWV